MILWLDSLHKIISTAIISNSPVQVCLRFLVELKQWSLGSVFKTLEHVLLKICIEYFKYNLWMKHAACPFLPAWENMFAGGKSDIITIVLLFFCWLLSYKLLGSFFLQQCPYWALDTIRNLFLRHRCQSSDSTSFVTVDLHFKSPASPGEGSKSWHDCIASFLPTVFSTPSLVEQEGCVWEGWLVLLQPSITTVLFIGSWFGIPVFSSTNFLCELLMNFLGQTSFGAGWKLSQLPEINSIH